MNQRFLFSSAYVRGYKWNPLKLYLKYYITVHSSISHQILKTLWSSKIPKCKTVGCPHLQANSYLNCINDKLYLQKIIRIPNILILFFFKRGGIIRLALFLFIYLLSNFSVNHRRVNFQIKKKSYLTEYTIQYLILYFNFYTPFSLLSLSISNERNLVKF